MNSSQNKITNEIEPSFYNGFNESHLAENTDQIEYHKKQLILQLYEVRKVNESKELDLQISFELDAPIKNAEEFYKFSIEVNELISKIFFLRKNHKRDLFKKSLFEITYHFAMLSQISQDARIQDLAINASNNFTKQSLYIASKLVTKND
jgi:hypothetical protein